VITQPALFAVFGGTLALICGTQRFGEMPAVQYVVGGVWACARGTSKQTASA
jgi:hypothetical protein